MFSAKNMGFSANFFVFHLFRQGAEKAFFTCLFKNSDLKKIFIAKFEMIDIFKFYYMFTIACVWSLLAIKTQLLAKAKQLGENF